MIEIIVQLDRELPIEGHLEGEGVEDPTPAQLAALQEIMLTVERYRRVLLDGH